MVLSRLFSSAILFSALLSAQWAFTVNSDGLQTLTWNGTSYYRTSGSNTPFQWFAWQRSGACPAFGSNGWYFLPGATFVKDSDNATWFRQTYRNGQSDSSTVKVTVSEYDSATLRGRIEITNNDGTNAMCVWSVAPFPLYIPSTNKVNAPQAVNARGQALLYASGNWGSLAQWTDFSSAGVSMSTSNWTTGNYQVGVGNGYGTGSGDFSDTWHGDGDTIAPGATKTYDMFLRMSPAGASEAEIAPEAYASWRAIQPSQTSQQRWPDRRSVLRWFWGNYGYYNATNNPRGCKDASLNAMDSAAFRTAMLGWADTIIGVANSMTPKPFGVLIWDIECQEFAHALTYAAYPNKLNYLAPEVNAIADEVIGKLKAAGLKIGLSVRPNFMQFGSTTPSGACNPNDIKPSDGVGYGGMADVYIKYPNSNAWPDNSDRIWKCTGTTQEITFSGQTHWTANHSLGTSDLSIKCFATTWASGPLSYTVSGITSTQFTVDFPSVSTGRCVALVNGSQTWTVQSNSGPGFQTSPRTEAEMVNQIVEKIRYAMSRWGADFFYADSMVYPGGGVLTRDFWVAVRSQLGPDVLIFPEQENYNTFQFAAPYTGTQTVGSGFYTGDVERAYWPNAFHYVQAGDINFTTYASEIRRAIKQGDVIAVDGWYYHSSQSNLSAQFALAAAEASCLTMTDINTSRSQTFSENARTAYKYPLKLRVRFATSANVADSAVSNAALDASADYCEKTEIARCYLNGVLQSTAALSLAGKNVFRKDLYTFDGNLQIAGVPERLP